MKSGASAPLFHGHCGVAQSVAVDTPTLWIDSLCDGLVVVDANFRVRHANAASRSVFAADPATLAGLEFFEVCAAARAAQAELRDAASRRAAHIVQAPVATGDRRFEIHASPLPDGGLTLLFVDLRVRMAAERRTGEELASLAHDLRNPLAPLRTSLELLKRPTVADATKERARGIMERQILELIGLIDRLQSVSRGMRDGIAVVPDASSQSPAAERVTDEAPRDRGAKVLVADDSALVQQSIVALLKAEGYEVRTVSDGLEALSAAAEWRPRYVLLDLHMPRLSGMDAARQLRQSDPAHDMVLVMMSGVSLNESWRTHAQLAGFDLCVDKTTDPVEWLAAMRAAGAR